jgi:hypothetical protein
MFRSALSEPAPLRKDGPQWMTSPPVGGTCLRAASCVTCGVWWSATQSASAGTD